MIPFRVGVALVQSLVGSPMASVPWGVGETLEYGGHWSVFNVGTARMRVDAIDTIRGVPSWRFAFTSEVSAAGFRSKSDLASWTGIADFVSRRYTHVVSEKNFDRHDDYRIFGDSGFFRNLRPTDTGKVAAPRAPIDDLAFFYYVRTIPLKVGVTDTFRNYYRLNRNPVIVKVLKRAGCELPDGTKLQCLVLNPIVDDPPNGMFMKKRNARLWLTDDPRRILVEIDIEYFFGVVKLKLNKITAAPRAG